MDDIEIVVYLLYVIIIGVVGYVFIDASTENYGTITIADITDFRENGSGILVKDTEGRIWVLYYNDPFWRDDCAIGQTLDIRWWGLDPEPRDYENTEVLRVVE